MLLACREDSVGCESELSSPRIRRTTTWAFEAGRNLRGTLTWGVTFWTFTGRHVGMDVSWRSPKPSRCKDGTPYSLCPSTGYSSVGVKTILAGVRAEHMLIVSEFHRRSD